METVVDLVSSSVDRRLVKLVSADVLEHSSDDNQVVKLTSSEVLEH